MIGVAASQLTHGAAHDRHAIRIRGGTVELGVEIVAEHEPETVGPGDLRDRGVLALCGDHSLDGELARIGEARREIARRAQRRLAVADPDRPMSSPLGRAQLETIGEVGDAPAWEECVEHPRRWSGGRRVVTTNRGTVARSS